MVSVKIPDMTSNPLATIAPTEALILTVMSHGAEESEGLIMRRIQGWPEAGWAPPRPAIHHSLNALVIKCFVAKLDRDRMDFANSLGSGPRRVSNYVITGHGREALTAWVARMKRVLDSQAVQQAVNLAVTNAG
jgi:hypothetical protein